MKLSKDAIVKMVNYLWGLYDSDRITDEKEGQFIISMRKCIQYDLKITDKQLEWLSDLYHKY